MSPIEAEAAVRHISDLFPNVKPAHISAMMQTFTREGFELAKVKSIANDMRGSDRMFNLDQLVKIVNPPAKDRPAEYASHDQRRRLSAAEYDAQAQRNAEDLERIAAMSDEDLAELKTEALKNLPENIRPLYAEKDPRRSRALGLEIARVLGGI